MKMTGESEQIHETPEKTHYLAEIKITVVRPVDFITFFRPQKTNFSLEEWFQDRCRLVAELSLDSLHGLGQQNAKTICQYIRVCRSISQ